MNENREESPAIRKYLLGDLADREEMRRIEEKILIDDDFNERLDLAEDKLIEEYVDGTLNDADDVLFRKVFLVFPERRRQVTLIQNLKKYEATAGSDSKTLPANDESPHFDWKSLFAPKAFRFALASLLILVVGFGIWFTIPHRSDASRGLDQLRLAYRDRRPIEARVVGLEYAPLNETRGEYDSDQSSARDRAERFLSYAEADNPNAQTLRALGKLYLTGYDYARANENFERASALETDNAELHSDWGATLLELANEAGSKHERAKVIEFLDQSLKHLEIAIRLDPRMPEPRFNRALCLQALVLPHQAKEAWREYLEIDPNSRWADEARAKLKLLDEQAISDRSAADIEQEFMAALAADDRETAWKILNMNRELIRDKYLPQRLAMSFLSASDSEKAPLQRAMAYAGDLEWDRIKDPFPQEMARFYSNLSTTAIPLLLGAHKSMRQGYESCLKLEYSNALVAFTVAAKDFRQAGDIWNSKLGEYFISYCLINIDRINDGNARLINLVDFARGRKYKWLEVTALYWLGSSFRSFKEHTSSKQTFERALALSIEIGDRYAIQRNSMELAKRHSFVGQKQLALAHLQRVFEETRTSGTSMRQTYRNYADASPILTKANLLSAASSVAIEAVFLADATDDAMFMALSRVNAAFASVHIGDFAEAKGWLERAKVKIESIRDDKSRERMTAYSLLGAGFYERRNGDYENSEVSYQKAVELYSKMEMPSNMHVAQKGKLLALLGLSKSSELDDQIPVVARLTEEYRDRILEDQERTSFFDSEESIYDIAVDHKFRTGRFEEAYNFAEVSSSRTLLDWLKKGDRRESEESRARLIFEESAKPIGLSSIRDQLPANVQILQYSVLDDKVLIWLVSREKFIVSSTSIKSSELREIVEDYLRLLSRSDRTTHEESRQISSRLYEILISPIRDSLDTDLNLCIIPNKFLFHLPFAALMSNRRKVLLEDLTILYSPSANVLLAATQRARRLSPDRNETLLGIGDPAFAQQGFEPFRRLPTAEREVLEIGSLYQNSQSLIGTEASKAAVLSLLRNADVVHFAGHYVAKETPLASYMLLAHKSGGRFEDGRLTNGELIGTQLPRVKLVILSACQTGVETYLNGEGMIGLSRTFLAAGVPLVIGTQWNVDTNATEQLMKRFHFFRRTELMPSVAALRKAQLEMANDTEGRFSDPNYWAGFAAYGGLAEF